MAVEIRELVIKAIIVNEEVNAPAAASGTEVAIRQEQIIQECVNQVLKIIKKSQYR